MKLKVMESKKRATLLEICSDVRIPKDYPWKILAKLTNDLHYLLDAQELSKLTAIIRSRDFDAYKKLGEEWGLQSMYLNDKPLAKVRAIYQIVSLLKKFQFDTDRDARIKKAGQKVVQAEKACQVFNTEGYKKLIWSDEEWMRHVFTYAKSFLEKLLGRTLPDEDKLTEWSRHGPGANLDTLDGKTNTFSKYENWPYSCTKDAFRYARYAIQSDPRWLGALEDDYRRVYNIPKNAILDQRVFWQQVFWIVPGNRITFVPKNAETERSIAIEPAMNLYLQLGVDGYIRRQLLRWGIDIDNQEKNQELARIGSLFGTFCTIDLASASDSISVRLCECLLGKDWYKFLMDLRSPQGEYKGSKLVYEKISSMGNGFTFALETAIFASIVYGVQMEVNGFYDAESCAIYGDDIIVETSIAEKVIEALANCGFTTNKDKTFIEGPFRESCGADWFQGKQIRPVFLSSYPTTAPELFNDYNRIKRVMMLRWEVEESEICKMIHKWIPVALHGLRGPVSDEDFDTYIHTTIPFKRYDSGMYPFPRLLVNAVPQRFPKTGFLFGKLMNTLRENKSPLTDAFGFRFVDLDVDKFEVRFIKGMRLNAKGSVFALTDNRLVRVSQKNSATSNWQSEYSERSPTYVSCYSHNRWI